MPTHHIACIHGIGKHANDWAQPAKKPTDTQKDRSTNVAIVEPKSQTFGDLLEELWDKYLPLQRLGPFEDNIVIHSIHYDDAFETLFEAWGSHIKSIKRSLSSSPLLAGDIEWASFLLDSLSNEKGNNNWAFTHLLDLLVFAGSPTIQDRIVVYVGKQLLSLIKEHPTDSISVVSHSMGCAVAHKAIQAMYNEAIDINGKTLETLNGDFKFWNLCNVSNTSYALSRKREDHYKGIVRPSSRSGRGCCSSWINVNHRLDPVGQFQRFDYRKDPEWLDPNIDQLHLHRDILLSKISSPDIHSILHYFRDPALHIPYFEVVLAAKFSNKTRKTALADFDKATRHKDFKSISSHLETLDTTRIVNFKNFFDKIQKFFDLTKQV